MQAERLYINEALAVCWTILQVCCDSFGASDQGPWTIALHASHAPHSDELRLSSLLESVAQCFHPKDRVLEAVGVARS